MKSNKGFTLIELLAVIIILGIVSVIGATTVLPYMSKSREKAFRIEATEVVNSAQEAVRLIDLGQASLKDDENSSCIVGHDLYDEDENGIPIESSWKPGTTYCFTVEELIDLGVYTGDKNSLSGSVFVDSYDDNTPSRYTLYLKKNDEFKIIFGRESNYKDNGELSSEDWNDYYATCYCENSSPFLPDPGPVTPVNPDPFCGPGTSNPGCIVM